MSALSGAGLTPASMRPSRSCRCAWSRVRHGQLQRIELAVVQSCGFHRLPRARFSCLPLAVCLLAVFFNGRTDPAIADRLLDRAGLPVLHWSPYACMPSPLPRWNRWLHMPLASPTMAAFPEFSAGRLPHRVFRGLLSIHSLRPACSRDHLHDPLHRRLRRSRYLLHRYDCYRLERPLPGGTDSH